MTSVYEISQVKGELAIALDRYEALMHVVDCDDHDDVMLTIAACKNCLVPGLTWSTYEGVQATLNGAAAPAIAGPAAIENDLPVFGIQHTAAMRFTLTTLRKLLGRVQVKVLSLESYLKKGK